MSANVHDVTALLLERVGAMETWRLQKLLYYTQAWHLAYFDEPLFPDPVQAWSNGPVVPSVYNCHRGRFGVMGWPEGKAINLDSRATQLVSWIAQRYGQFSGEELSEFTHAEAPWRLTRGGLRPNERSTEAIAHQLMRDYYRRQLMEPDFAVRGAVANARLEGFEFDAADVERMQDVAKGVKSADDAVAEIVAAHRGSSRSE